jgi:glutamate-ammonia-ligase adenylyltransferase
MIDIEFAVQFLVLAHSHQHPQLTQNLGNIALLGICANRA